MRPSSMYLGLNGFLQSTGAKKHVGPLRKHPTNNSDGKQTFCAEQWLPTLVLLHKHPICDLSLSGTGLKRLVVVVVAALRALWLRIGRGNSAGTLFAAQRAQISKKLKNTIWTCGTPGPTLLASASFKNDSSTLKLESHLDG